MPVPQTACWLHSDVACCTSHSSCPGSEAACLEAVAGVREDEEGKSSCEQRGGQLGFRQNAEVSKNRYSPGEANQLDMVLIII